MTDSNYECILSGSANRSRYYRYVIGRRHDSEEVE